MLTIKSEVSTIIRAGSLVKEEFFYVADEAGNLVGRKSHSTEAEAQAELTGLAGYAEGLEFARAQFPELGDKAHVGKANVVAEFLAWKEAGKPVKEPKSADVADSEADGTEGAF
ncbi:hypothetical protein [Ralstonia phage Reminis]|uniref:Uncharacterized protein n=1 Tax=Ralstonia phage Reminis TaxID=2662139 RepID=A0A5Q2U8I9_9CAUD|nr:hypothetical protein [Ralstonia phage Reminis]